jgi:hypothetical protein
MGVGGYRFRFDGEDGGVPNWDAEGKFVLSFGLFGGCWR